ncbi:glycosyltransferase [Algoriphagus formosus]|uniref:Glycosyltransferase n=1 Tax=Algoriphagus formosus TaxID=2007308 RepID=A0A4R5USJ1_9BACT|nr:glycosyltransferase [Algoriphagus aquimaris]TDK42043.1 glycosyltransferase [Algoriphagus aquimaris]
MPQLAPIVLFTFNRISETRATVNALRKNFLAKESDLFIFSDGPKFLDDKKVAGVHNFIDTISGFKSVTIIKSSVNKGLASSIIEGVSEILKTYDSVIVLEDDLISSPNFLDFMNQALEFYRNNPMVFSISGYTMDLPGLKNNKKDYYLGYRASSWGWGTWADRWTKVDWDSNEFKPLSWKEKRNFRKGGNDLPRMLNNQLKKKIDSWAIRWVYHQFKIGGLTVFPKSSKILSVGFGDDATHTKKTRRFDTVLDNGKRIHFEFDDELILNPKLLKDFRNKFSIWSRIKDRIW